VCVRRDCGKKKLPLNRKEPPSEPGRAAMCLSRLGVERTTTSVLSEFRSRKEDI